MCVTAISSASTPGASSASSHLGPLHPSLLFTRTLLHGAFPHFSIFLLTSHCFPCACFPALLLYYAHCLFLRLFSNNLSRVSLSHRPEQFCSWWLVCPPRTVRTSDRMIESFLGGKCVPAGKHSKCVSCLVVNPTFGLYFFCCQVCRHLNVWN